MSAESPSRWSRQRVTSHAITNIGCLITNDETAGDYSPLGRINNATVVLRDGVVEWVGSTDQFDSADVVTDANGGTVIPGFVDSHAHMVFAGDRTAEFDARMKGESYSAGGIRTTVSATRAASDTVLESRMLSLADEMLRSGITTYETKSGYGLTVGDEARSLHIAAKQTAETTFLGAHVVPQEFTQAPDDYVSLVTGEMLEACAPHARWIDVFCDRGAFDVDQAREILTAGMARGLLPRLHANQLQHGPGVQLAVELGAASADHCTHLTDADIDALAGSSTVATLLPGAEFSTRAEYPDARRLVKAGVTVALATDCNPGSSYTTSMPFCIAVAVRDMGFSPDQAVWSATAGGAQALRRNDIGRLVPGYRADLVLLNAPSHVHLAYRPGVNLIERVWRSGSSISSKVAS